MSMNRYVGAGPNRAALGYVELPKVVVKVDKTEAKVVEQRDPWNAKSDPSPFWNDERMTSVYAWSPWQVHYKPGF